MEIKRKSTAIWSGTGKEGKGKLTSQSGVLSNSQYGFQSRFADGIGTNPEELIASAHAGCFSMKLAFNLQAAGYAADEIKTECEVVLDNGAITKSNLSVEVRVQNLPENKFSELLADAKANCPVSKLFNCEINLTSKLI